MQCLKCGGGFEYAGGGQYARCMRCLTLFNVQGGQLTEIVVQAPGGGHNPEFNAMFAKNLGFGPPPQQAQNHPPGTFDMGGGYQLQVTIDGKDPEKFAKDEVKSMVWGWIIGAIFLVVLLLAGLGLGIYIWVQAKDGGSGPAAKTPSAAKWDGKSTFECGGNDAVTLTGVTASAGVKASANCQLTLVNVNITAPVGVEASGNSTVTVTGGSVTGSSNSAVASANGKVNFVGTKVSGPVKKSGGGKITGAN
jgi:hypothetical protein